MRLQEEIIYSEGSKAAVQAPHRGCGCRIPGDIQGKVEWSPRYPDLVNGNPAHSNRLILFGHNSPFYSNLLILFILWYYYNSMPLVMPLVSSFPLEFFLFLYHNRASVTLPSLTGACTVVFYFHSFLLCFCDFFLL